MSDMWKANCEKVPADYVEFSARHTGGMLLSAMDMGDQARVALSPASCRSLCAWLVARGFGAQAKPDQAMRDNLNAASAAVADMGERGHRITENRERPKGATWPAQPDALVARVAGLEARAQHMSNAFATRLSDEADLRRSGISEVRVEISEAYKRIYALERRFASMKDAING